MHFQAQAAALAKQVTGKAAMRCWRQFATKPQSQEYSLVSVDQQIYELTSELAPRFVFRASWRCIQVVTSTMSMELQKTLSLSSSPLSYRQRLWRWQSDQHLAVVILRCTCFNWRRLCR